MCKMGGYSVAIVTCVSPRRRRNGTLAILNILAPSILRTVDRAASYSLYVGIDATDNFDAQHGVALRKLVAPMPVHVLPFPQAARARIPWNDVLHRASRDDHDYVVRVNDDTEFSSKRWTQRAIHALTALDPPNVGVVGPTCREGNMKILTHDFVHLKTHMAIFRGVYYPSSFRNWFLDDWMTHVYGEQRTQKLHNWVVRHHTAYHGTRYAPDRGAIRFLKHEIADGRQRIKKYLARWITVVTVSSGFWDMFENWMHHFESVRTGMQVTVISEDDRTAAKLRDVHGISSIRGEHSAVSSMALKYDTGEYRRLVSRRAKYLLDVMKSNPGAHVLYSDIDTVWLADPRPYLTGSVDVWGSVDDVIHGKPYICTGFLGFRPTSATRRLLSAWQGQLQSPQLNQPVFNELIIKQNVSVQPLPSRHFPAGNAYFSKTADRHLAIVVHNNFIQGKERKIARFRMAGLWRS